MTRSNYLWGLGVLVSALGCSDKGSDDPEGAMDASGGSESVSTGGGGGASGGAEGSGGESPSPTEPYSLEGGSCRPNSLPGPEPVFENTETFAHIGGLVTHGDDLIFVEYYDFNDPPARIARLDQTNTVTTVLDNIRGSSLKVYGDSLYFLDNEGLKSLDLTDASATPTILTQVDGIVVYDESQLVFKDETDTYFSVAVGQVDDVSAAVNLGTLDELVRQASIQAGTLYFHNVDNVLSVQLDGSGSSQVTADDSFRYIWGLATDATNAYFDDTPLRSIPLAGGEVKTLGTAGPDGFGRLATFSHLIPSGTVVYWADDGESWGWTAIDGMSCGILGQHKGFFEGAVAVSDNYVYARGESEIYRVDRVD